MLAYDDPLGITAPSHRTCCCASTPNRDEFDLDEFEHKVQWNADAHGLRCT